MRTDVSKHWGDGTWISRECSGALEQMEKYLTRINERAEDTARDMEEGSEREG